jgi:S-adenosylmethionine:tRNA ribosyltransferase-isomerase
MNVSDFDFDLPPELIAQEPAADRNAARLMWLERATGHVAHRRVRELPELLVPGDLLVVNNTRVFPARLRGHRVPSGGAVEFMLIGRAASSGIRGEATREAEHPGAVEWDALVHPGQKLKPGAAVVFEGERPIHGLVLARLFHGRRLVRLWREDGGDVDEAIDRLGHVPLPPYIKRSDRSDDRDRYQTVFASERGSIAAPTAGLHFSRALTERLTARGVLVAEITLHVGFGTFQPVRVERVEEHRVEPERYHVPPAAAAAINDTIREGRRVIAVGTTTTRALETAGRGDARVVASGWGETGLFIYPGFDFRVISGLMTNFHLPRSSLLMLVSAFASQRQLAEAYHAAIAERYRFYSYGDAMLIT